MSYGWPIAELNRGSHHAELTPAASYGTIEGHGHGLLGQTDRRSTMGDSSRPHVFPLTSPPVASDGHARQGRRGSHAEATSTSNAISVPLTGPPVASDGHARQGRSGSNAEATVASNAIGRTCLRCHVSLEKKSRSQFKSNEDGYWCNRCYKSRFHEPENHEDDDADDQEPMSQGESSTIQLSVCRTIAHHSWCIFRCLESPRLTRVGKAARQQALRVNRAYIPFGSRCCPHHLEGNVFSDDALSLLESNTPGNEFKASDIEDMLNLLLESQPNPLDFKVMCEESLRVYTGRLRGEFEDLVSQFHVTPGYQTKKHKILGVYLTYLYSGFTQQQISATFSIPQTTVSHYIDVGRQALHQFVSNNMGLREFTRRILVENRTRNVETLYQLSGTDVAVTVRDATYLYLPKSSNFRFQSATYSSNKARNLMKPMVAVTPNGMIVDVFGPDSLWKASISDGEILKQIMGLQDFKELFKPGDIFVVDRGFRCAKEAFQSANFVVKIPPNVARGQKQLTTSQANQQRECTAVRWIVEVINRQLKCNRYWSRTLGAQARGPKLPIFW